MKKLGLETQVWKDVGTFQAAYDIGKAEAEAAMCLLREVDKRILERVTGLVQWQPELFHGWMHMQELWVIVVAFFGSFDDFLA